MIKGFAKFLECLDLFFDMLALSSADDCQIKIFGSVTLNNKKNIFYVQQTITLIVHGLVI